MGGDAGRANAFLSTLGAAGWGGLSGQFGNPWGFGTMFGSTASPTLWVNYPGVGAVPMAIPFGGWSGDTGTAQQHHAGFNFQPHHSGGRISRFHLGGAIARAPRLHSGGPTLGSSRLASGAGESGRAPQVNFYAFTDLRKIAEHAARSHVNRKVIMDTVTGNRIDLGI
jgi:hypothetical protein